MIRILLFILAFLIIVNSGFYYLILISSEPNIYFSHFIGIAFSLFIILLATRLYLYPEYRRPFNIIVLVLFLIPAIFYLTDNAPIITFQVIPENPKSIKELKVFIEASDDRCLRIRRLPEITGFPTATIEDLRAFSWIPKFYCPTTYNRTIDFINWPDKLFAGNLNDLKEIDIKFFVEDSLGQKTIKQIKFPIPK